MHDPDSRWKAAGFINRRRASMIEIDTTLVKELIRTQFPLWAELPVAPVENDGWDNRTFRLGERMSVSLPSALRYVAQVEKEHRWLPVLRPQLPLPVGLFRSIKRHGSVRGDGRSGRR